MAAISHARRLVYFPIPKNATSSMKLVMYEVDTGTPFTEEVRKELRVDEVHSLYPSSDFRAPWQRYYRAYTSIAIVRDPIKRLLSAYRNRVVHMKVLEEKSKLRGDLARKNLSITPSLDEFVENLEQYRLVSRKVRHHTIPQSKYIGSFWKKIDHRIPLERIHEIPGIIKEATGQDVVLTKEQTSGPSVSVDELSKHNFNKLVKLYSHDYRMLRKLYSPEKLR